MGSMLETLPQAARPRERLQRCGAHALADYELLACVLGRGTAGEPVLVMAQRLLQRCGSLSSIAAASVEELTAVRGIGPAKALQLQAAFALGVRREQERGDTGEPLTTPEAVCRIVEPALRTCATEHTIAVLLDTKYHLLRIAPVAVGTLNASLVHPREVFHEAIRARAAAVIVAHNHPSGDPTPSAEDVALTERLSRAGELLGIPLLDHVIVGRAQSVSCAQEGHLG